MNAPACSAMTVGSITFGPEQVPLAVQEARDTAVVCAAERDYYKELSGSLRAECERLRQQLSAANAVIREFERQQFTSRV